MSEIELSREDIRFLAQEGVSRTSNLNVRTLATRLLKAEDALVRINVVIEKGGVVADALDKIQGIVRGAIPSGYLPKISPAPLPPREEENP